MRFRAACLAAVLLLSGRGRADAQATPAPPPATPAIPADSRELQHDLERIRRELARPDRLNPKLPADFQPMFRVDVEEKFPDIQTWLDPRELRAPTMSMPSAHAEFLRMVTPQDVTQPYSNSELLQVLVTGLLGKLAMQSIATGIQGAIDGRRTHGACLEVRQSLIDLNYERLRAGLDPVPVPDC